MREAAIKSKLLKIHQLRSFLTEFNEVQQTIIFSDTSNSSTSKSGSSSMSSYMGKKLYKSLGKVEGISKIVEQFFLKALKDETLGAYYQMKDD